MSINGYIEYTVYYQSATCIQELHSKKGGGGVVTLIIPPPLLPSPLDPALKWYSILLFKFLVNPGHLNDIHVCSNIIELEVGQILQCKYLYKAKGVRDFSIDLWFCAFILGGSSLASHILAVQLTFELEVHQTR